VRRLLVLHGHEPLLRRSFLPEHVRACQAGTAKASIDIPQPASNSPEYHRARRDRELARLTEALRAHNGSVARAAAAVGISRQRAYRLMEAAGVVGVAGSEADDISQGPGEGR
jgi:transcriptional regulator of acetoin/glycerol metabolism